MRLRINNTKAKSSSSTDRKDNNAMLLWASTATTLSPSRSFAFRRSPSRNAWCWRQLLLLGLLGLWWFRSEASPRRSTGRFVSAFVQSHPYSRHQDSSFPKNSIRSQRRVASLKILSPRYFHSDSNARNERGFPGTTEDCPRNTLPPPYRPPFRGAQSPRGPLFGNSSDNDDDNPGDGELPNDARAKPKRPGSMRRIGGRSRGKPPKPLRPSDPTEANSGKSPLGTGGGLVAFLLALTLLKNLFFGGGGDPGYYYYSYSSTSVIETTVDGRSERTERSDFRTNIPGMTDPELLDRSNDRDARIANDYFYLFGE